MNVYREPYPIDRAEVHTHVTNAAQVILAHEAQGWTYVRVELCGDRAHESACPFPVCQILAFTRPKAS